MGAFHCIHSFYDGIVECRYYYYYYYYYYTVLGWLGHAAHRAHLENSMVKQLLFATRILDSLQLVVQLCGTWTHYVMKGVKYIGQQMGYRSL